MRDTTYRAPHYDHAAAELRGLRYAEAQRANKSEKDCEAGSAHELRNNDRIPAVWGEPLHNRAGARAASPAGYGGRFAAGSGMSAQHDPGPVHNVITGNFDANSLPAFVKGYRAELEIRAKWMGENSLGDGQLVDASNKDINNIRQKLDMLLHESAQPKADPDELARTCFSEISKICKTAATRLDKATYKRWGRSAPRGLACTKKTLSTFFSDYGTLANELKRNHYTRVAKHRLDAYVAQEVSNIGAVASGLRENRTAAELKMNKSMGGTLRLSMPLSGLFSIGPAVGIQLMKQKRIFVDEDRMSVILDEESIIFSAGAALKHGKLLGKNRKGSTLFSLYTVASAFFTRGNFHKHATLEAGLEHQVFRESAKYTYWFRSGDLKSWGNRRCLAAGQHYGKKMQRFIGERYVAEKGMPIMDQRKLQKGLNTGALARLSAALVTSRPAGHQGAGSLDLREITALAYPTIESTLQQREQAIGANPLCPAASKSVYNPLTAIRPLPFPANSELPKNVNSVKRIGCTVEGAATINSLQLNRHHQNEIHAGASAKGRSDISYNKVGFTRLGGSHTQMDPRLIRDIGHADKLVDRLKNHFGEQHPQLHRMRQIEDACGPAALGALTAATVGEHYQAASQQLAQIRKDFIEFVGLAQEQHALQDSANRQSLGAEGLERFQLKMANIVCRIFGADASPESNAVQAKFFARLHNPQFLMERCFDAMSIALGRVGILAYHIKKANAGLHLERSVCDDVSTLRARLDADYAHTRRLLEEIHLPVNRADLLRSATLTSLSASISTMGGFGLEATVDVYHSPLQDIRGNESDPSYALHTPSDAAHGTELSPALAKTLGSIPFNAATSANLSSAVASYTWLQRHSTSHPNPIRLGLVEQHITVVRGGGILALALERYIQNGVDKRLQEKVGPESLYAAERGRTGSVIPVIAALARTQFCDDSSDISILVQTKTPNPVGDLVYETSEQCARAMMHRSQSSKASFAVPLHAAKVPATISGNIAFSTVSQSIISEVYGDCPAYHLLGFPQIDKLLKDKDCCVPENPRRGWQAPLLQERRPVKTPLTRALPVPGHDPCDSYQGPLFNYAKLQEKLLSEINQPRAKAAKPDNADTGSDHDATYMMVNYFSNPKAITGVLEKFCRYQSEMRPMGAAQRVVSAKKERTEFHRFDDDPKLWACMQVMQDSARFGPGATPAPRKGMESMHEYSNMNPDPRPRMSNQEIDALEQVKAHFEKFTNLSSVDRMKYFLNPEKGSYGQIAFQAYIRIMVRYEKINNAAKPHHAYETQIIDKEPEGWRMRGKSLLKGTNRTPVIFTEAGDDEVDGSEL